MLNFKLEICSGTSCHLMGSFDLYKTLDTLPLRYSKHLEVVSIPCLGECNQGPNIRLDGQIYTHVTPEEIKFLIKKQVDKLGGEENGS